LVLRVKKLLERQQTSPDAREKFQFGDLTIDVPHCDLFYSKS